MSETPGKNYMIGQDIPTFDEMERQAKQEDTELLQQLQLLATDHYDRPEFTLEQRGIGFAPLGNIMAICAEMKNGKTWLMLQLCAALLKGKWGDITCSIAKPCVLWFDTEQDKYDTMLILRRIHQLCGWDYNVDHEEFRIYNLREISYENRKKAITQAIEAYRPQVVFIDGIRDLVSSVNDEQECYNLINDMMSITAKNHCCIWSVLHVNPNSDKMRGHLGTEMGHKTTDVFSVKKKKETDGKYIFAVEQVAARHRDVDGWKFEIRDFFDEKKYAVPVQITEGVANPEEQADRWNELHDILEKYVPDVEAIARTPLQTALKNGEQMGSSKAWKMISEAIDLGVLEQVIGGKYRLKKTRPDNPLAEKTQEELPF